jgi:hypothetical protein
VTRARIDWTNGSIQVTVNGTQAAAITTTFPTGNLIPCIAHINRTAVDRLLYVEKMIDRYE